MEIGTDIVKRIALGVSAIIGLAVVFMVQHIDLLGEITATKYSSGLHFTVNRMLRIFFNDACMLLFIHALFHDRNVLRLAIYIQVIDLFVLFPLYLALKLPFEGASELSSPFLSQLHRLIVNPTLMILLIPAVYYQKFIQKR